MRSNFDFTPFLRSSVGFENLNRLIDIATRAAEGDSSFPPYNIEKLKSTGLDEEASFTNRYSRLINRIMSERDTISPEYVKSQVAYAF